MTDTFRQAGVAATRVERSFAFVDLSGFTSYTDTKGDDQAVVVLGSFRALVRDVAAARGVRIAKWLGDGAMLVGVESGPLIEAIVEIMALVQASDSPLALRAGITTGPVILFEGDDYIGQAVNMAARLCDEADPDEVLAPAALTEVLDEHTVATPIGSRSIRGLEDPIALVRLATARG